MSLSPGYGLIIGCQANWLIHENHAPLMRRRGIVNLGTELNNMLE